MTNTAPKPPCPSERSPDAETSRGPLDARRRKILFRSWHRGMLEMDLIMGRFADAALASLTEAELDDLEKLLEAEDRDVFGWVSGEHPTPKVFDTPVLRKIREFHGAIRK